MSNRVPKKGVLRSLSVSLWTQLLAACAAQPSPTATALHQTAATPLSDPTGQSALAFTPVAPAAPAPSATSDCAPEHQLCREEDFANAHRADAPLNGQWTQVAGQRAYFSLPKRRAAPMPGIVLLHTARGLNKNIQLWSDRLAEEGYAVLAVDFYEGKVANTDPEALALRDQANSRADRNVAIAKAAYTLLSTDPHVQAPRIALVGWSFGGAWATYLSTELPNVAAVITYAGNAVGDVETARRIKAPILMIRGSRDRLFEGAKAAKFEERLKAAQKQVELVGVDGGHALADPTRDDYSATGDWVAFLRVRDFLKAHLAR